MSGGTLSGSGAVNINGAGSWTGGTLNGAGTTVFSGNLALTGNGTSRLISGRNVTFAGATTWSNTLQATNVLLGTIGVANGATLNNTGTWVDQAANITAITTSGSASTFNNTGTYTKTGTAYTDIQTRFNNTGTLNVSNNVLYLSGGGSLTNRVDVAGGAMLQLNAGTFSLTGLQASAGAGVLNVGGGSANATGSNAFGCTLGVSGGLLDVAGTFDASSVPNPGLVLFIKGSAACAQAAAKARPLAASVRRPSCKKFAFTVSFPFELEGRRKERRLRCHSGVMRRTGPSTNLRVFPSGIAPRARLKGST